MKDVTSVITVELTDHTKVIVPNSLELITPYVLQEQGDWFEDEIRFLRKLVQPGSTVVDIGANYGVYALSLARQVGASGQVWAFEPATQTARLLRDSAKTNNTPWLQIIQQALSDREGTGWLHMTGQAELNSLTRTGPEDMAALSQQGEHVELTTLDRCLEAYGWKEVDVLKIDAEGEEERILKGGEKFFNQHSPLVMFEVKAGAELNLQLVEQFELLGYQCFRLIPGLDALVPFTADQGVDGYLLNLFAAKPNRAASLAAAGWLMDRNQQVTPAAEACEQQSWLDYLENLPYARRLAVQWQKQAQQLEEDPLYRALNSWVQSQDDQAPIVERYWALKQSLALFQQACLQRCGPGRWASLARVASASGERMLVVQALEKLVEALQSGAEVDLDEPFLSPDAIFDLITPTGPIKFWLEAAGLTALEEANSFSGFYTGLSGLARLKRIQALGYTNDRIKRRIDLLERRFRTQERAADESDSTRCWFHFLGLQEPLCCLDVGALSLQNEVEPWARWAHEECAEVLGFEPLSTECDELNQKAKERGAKIRYLPWALGDGQKHTLYITNAPMTSSLFPPARTTIDLFPALGELMQVEQQVVVQTHRLDDITEAQGADFLKLDVQGAELMILENAQNVLRSVSVIQCEVEFVELYEAQPLMADIDTYLRSQGFCFLRFAYIMGRPFKPLQQADHPYKELSQVLWGDAIYVRDFRLVKQWSIRQLQTAAFVLHEAYEAYDLVAFIINELDRRNKGDLASCYTAALMINRQDLKTSAKNH